MNHLFSYDLEQSATFTREGFMSRYYAIAVVLIAACQYGSAGLESGPTIQVAPQLRFPGVDVARTSHGGVSIRIIGAVLGESEPLFIVDGTPVTVRRGGTLDWLSPDDITSIRVVKHPAATTAYGPRAVNGVVVITTRWSLEPATR